jgi:hypothetical protein
MLLASVAFLLVAAATGWARDYLSIGPFASAEREVQKENDAAELPFSVSMQPEKSEPEQWVMVLDRELTVPEARRMTSLGHSAAFSYLRSLGARPLVYAAFLENAPKRHKGRQSAAGLELAQVFKLNILSVRDKAVVIDDWDVVDVPEVSVTGCLAGCRAGGAGRPGRSRR